MYISPDGRRFAHAAAATVEAFKLDPALASYYADYAPLTCKWLRHLEGQGDVHRPTRFDAFLWSILQRAGFRIQPAILPIRETDEDRSSRGQSED